MGIIFNYSMLRLQCTHHSGQTNTYNRGLPIPINYVRYVRSTEDIERFKDIKARVPYNLIYVAPKCSM